MFQVLTLAVMALTLALVVQRFTGRLYSNWPPVYYALAVAYTFGFRYSLNRYCVFAGAACALLLRFESLARWLEWTVRAIELAALACVLWRCLELILMW